MRRFAVFLSAITFAACGDDSTPANNANNVNNANNANNINNANNLNNVNNLNNQNNQNNVTDVGFDEGMDFGSGTGLYGFDNRVEVREAGRVVLEPAHRRGPNALQASELSNLPVTVTVPEEAQGELPVFIFSHGGGSRQNPGESGTDVALALASRGYAVLAMHHMARSRNDLIANVCGPLNVIPADCDAAIYTPYYESTDRPQDGIAVMDAFAQIENELSIQLDESRIGMIGHSGGTNTGLYLAGASRNAAPPSAPIVLMFSLSDPRPKAFVTLSPAGGDEAGWDPTSVVRPVFSATGAGDEDPEIRAGLFDDLPTGDKYRLFLNTPGINHGGYLLKTVGQQGEAYELSLLLQATTFAFADAYLNEDPVAIDWLNRGVAGELADELVTADPNFPAWVEK